MRSFATTPRTPGGILKIPATAFSMLPPDSSEFRKLSQEMLTVEVIPDKKRPGVSTLNVKDSRNELD